MRPKQRPRFIARVLTATAVHAGLSGIACGASNAPTAPETVATIRQNVESRFPGTHVLDVQPTTIPGLYEIFTGDQIVYADATGDRLIVGSMVDTKTKENLTDARLNEHGRIDFKTLPVNEAIKVVKGNGHRVFAVFSDPDCPFCQQLEKTLLYETDITMYVYLFPIAQLHPQAASKAHAIWCAPDRPKAWEDWMHEKKLPAAQTCSGDPVDALQRLGTTLHINSTPTMFFADGHRVAGALPAADLEKELASTQQTSASKPASK